MYTFLYLLQPQLRYQQFLQVFISCTRQQTNCQQQITGCTYVNFELRSVYISGVINSLELVVVIFRIYRYQQGFRCACLDAMMISNLCVRLGG